MILFFSAHDFFHIFYFLYTMLKCRDMNLHSRAFKLAPSILDGFTLIDLSIM